MLDISNSNDSSKIESSVVLKNNNSRILKPSVYKCWVNVWVISLLVLSVFAITVVPTHAKEISFIVQPILSEAQTIKSYKQLTEYLSVTTGYVIKIKTVATFQEYWIAIRRGNKYDLILDAAHFTSYRIKHNGYTVLAKIPETVSFSLISNSNSVFFEHLELIGKTMASLPPPSLGAVRLQQLYPNPVRLPRIVASHNAIDAIAKVISGTVESAIVPTPLLNDYPDVNVISTTTPVPHMAFSASPTLDKKIKVDIRRALIEAKNTVLGREMLEQINFIKFDKATNKVYKNYYRLLLGVWGY